MRQSDQELQNFIFTANEETVSTIIQLMDTIWSIKSRKLKNIYDQERIPESGSEKRFELAEDLVIHLKYFGSNGIAYGFRKITGQESGVSYLKMLREVAIFFNKMLKPNLDFPYLGKPLGWVGIKGKKPFNVPRIATVAEYEALIVEMLVSEHIRNKSEDELSAAFQEAGLDKEAANQAAFDILKIGSSGSVLIFLVQILGKKAVKEIILSILIKLIEKQVGKEAAKKIAQTLSKKITQKTFARLVSGVGWILIAYDGLKLASPATRITVPTLVYISTMRYITVEEETVFA